MSKELNSVIMAALEDIKAKDVVSMDVSELTDVMDTLVIASGTSSRHVKSIANSVVVDGKAAGHIPLGMEGLDEGEWALVDFGDTVVHVFQQTAREFYDLEKLWSMEPGSRSSQLEDE